MWLVMVTKADQASSCQLSQIRDARHLSLSPSHDNSLVLLFKSSCTIWDVIYSDSLKIIAEMWEDKWFDEAMYLLSANIIGWMCGQKW